MNVNKSVFLNNKKLTSIDIKFNQINGSFNCSNNNLETLEGCPKIVKEKVKIWLEKEKLLNIIKNEELNKNKSSNKI